MLEFLQRLFRKATRQSSSKNVAKERLRVVLVHDRVDVSPRLIEALRDDLIKVISEYMVIDQENFELEIDTSDSTVALMANIPIKEMKRIV